MTEPFDWEAYILAHNYAFCPIVYGKYDGGNCTTPPEKWLKLAKTDNATNILIKYTPDELESS